MAVIFFDGFNRPVEPTYWTTQGAIDYPGALRLPESTPVANNALLKNIGTQSNKKLYFGLRVGSYTVATSLGTTGQPFLVFYDSTDTSVLEILWTDNNITSPDIGLLVKQSGTVVATYTVLNSIASVITNTAPNGVKILSPNDRVFEFEIDLANDTLAIRFEGQNLQNDSNASSTTISSIGDIASIRVYGGAVANSNSCYVRDTYLVDDTGTFANTWLGSNFAVHSPDVSSGSPVVGDWTSTSQYNAATALNTNDSDTGYIRTKNFNDYYICNVDDISPTGVSPVVAGIRLNSVARKVQLDSAYKYAYRNKTTNTNYDMGTKIVLTNTAYQAKAAQFINVNPETAAQWTVSEINDNAFGVKSVDPA